MSGRQVTEAEVALAAWLAPSPEDEGRAEALAAQLEACGFESGESARVGRLGAALLVRVREATGRVLAELLEAGWGIAEAEAPLRELQVELVGPARMSAVAEVGVLPSLEALTEEVRRRVCRGA